MEIKPIVTQDFVVLQDEGTVTELVSLLQTKERRAAVIFHKQKYLGLIEKKLLLKSKLDVEKAKIKNYVQTTPIINENADLIETAYLMWESNMDFLPVESNKEIIGVVSGLDLAKMALELEGLKKIKVSDIKIVKPARLNKDEPVSAAMHIMLDEKIDHVPIFDQGKLFGVLSHKDLLRKYLKWSPKRDSLGSFNVAAASSKAGEPDLIKVATLQVSNFSSNYDLISVAPTESLKNALKLMCDNRISDLLVVDQNNYLGVLTIKNILAKVGSLKLHKEYTVDFIGLNETKLETHQKYNLKKVCDLEAAKLQRMLKNTLDLAVHIKEYKKEGNKDKYSVHLRLEYPGKIIATSDDDWDAENALRKAIDNAKNSIRNTYHENKRERATSRKPKS